MPSFSVDSHTRRAILRYTPPTAAQLLSRARRRVQFLMLAPYLLGVLALALLGLVGVHQQDAMQGTVLITLGLGCLIGLGAYAMSYGWKGVADPDFRQACREEMDRTLAKSPEQQEHIAQACTLDPAIATYVQALRQQGRVWDNTLAEKCRMYVLSWESYATQ